MPADLQGRIDAWPGPAHASADPQLCAEIRRMLREYLEPQSNASPSGAAGSRGGVVLSLIFERAAVLCIGIDWYDACGCLAKAVSDAEEMASAFREAYGEPIEVPASAGVGHTSIEEAMLTFAAELTERYSNQRELVVVYLAGHGMQQDGKVYLLPSDVSSEAPSASECIDVLKHVGAIQYARKAEGSLLLVVDTCRSEHAREGDEEKLSESKVATHHHIPKGALVCFAAPRGSDATDGGLLQDLLPRLCTPGTSVLEAVMESAPAFASSNMFDKAIRLYSIPERSKFRNMLRSRQLYFFLAAMAINTFSGVANTPAGPYYDWDDGGQGNTCNDAQTAIIQMCLAHDRSACELNPICHWCAVTPAWDLHPADVAYFGLTSPRSNRSWIDGTGCHMMSSPVNHCVDAGNAHVTVYDGNGLCPTITQRISTEKYESNKSRIFYPASI